MRRPTTTVVIVRAVLPFALCVGTGLAFVLCGGAQDVSAQKPVKESVVIVDSAPPPASPAEMSRASDAVIVARYTGKNRLIEPGAPGGFGGVESTSYAFEVLEVLKFDPLLPTGIGAQLELNLMGGDKELSTHIQRTRIAHTEPLQMNHTYVVFLARNSVRNELYLAWGAQSLYDVTTGTVRGVERERRRHEGVSATAFLGVLRTAQ